MQSQSFRGADVKEALSRVRASLGPDALIQSTRQVTNGRGGALGHAWVEVTATAPAGRPSWQFETNGRPTVVSPPRFSSLRSPPTERAPRPAMSRPGRTPTLGLDASELERELMTLRAMLDELNQSRPPRERVMTLLASFGIEGALARQLATRGCEARRFHRHSRGVRWLGDWDAPPRRACAVGLPLIRASPEWGRRRLPRQ